MVVMQAHSALQPLELRFAESTRRITALDFPVTAAAGVTSDIGAIGRTLTRVMRRCHDAMVQ